MTPPDDAAASSKAPRPAAAFDDLPPPANYPSVPAPSDASDSGADDAPPPPPPAPPSANVWTPPAPRTVVPYPMRFEVEYAERLSRWKTLLRLVLALPILVLLFFVAPGLVFPPYFVQWTLLGLTPFMAFGWFTVLARRKYPWWLHQGLGGILGFIARAQAYMLLLTDRYPSFDPDTSPVTLEYDYPAEGTLSRWRVFLWKSVLLIPQIIVLSFLMLAVSVVTVLAWLAILVTGQYPRGLFGFVTGVNRWSFRVIGYYASFTDRFPPFSLSASAGSGGRASAVICGVLGLIIGGSCGGVFTAAVLDDQSDSTDVTYARLLDGRPDGEIFVDAGIGGPAYTVALRSAVDADADLAAALSVAVEQRVVTFEIRHSALREGGRVAVGSVRLRYEQNGERSSDVATVLLVDGRPAPEEVPLRTGATVVAAFVIPAGARPVELSVDTPWPGTGGTLRFRFR